MRLHIRSNNKGKIPTNIGNINIINIAAKEEFFR